MSTRYKWLKLFMYIHSSIHSFIFETSVQGARDVDIWSYRNLLCHVQILKKQNILGLILGPAFQCGGGGG